MYKALIGEIYHFMKNILLSFLVFSCLFSCNNSADDDIFIEPVDLIGNWTLVHRRNHNMMDLPSYSSTDHLPVGLTFYSDSTADLWDMQLNLYTNVSLNYNGATLFGGGFQGMNVFKYRINADFNNLDTLYVTFERDMPAACDRYWYYDKFVKVLD